MGALACYFYSYWVKATYPNLSPPSLSLLNNSNTHLLSTLSGRSNLSLHPLYHGEQQPSPTLSLKLFKKQWSGLNLSLCERIWLSWEKNSSYLLKMSIISFFFLVIKDLMLTHSKEFVVCAEIMMCSWTIPQSTRWGSGLTQGQQLWKANHQQTAAIFKVLHYFLH